MALSRQQTCETDYVDKTCWLIHNKTRRCRRQGLPKLALTAHRICLKIETNGTDAEVNQRRAHIKTSECDKKE